jgi:hypothetical protein
MAIENLYQVCLDGLDSIESTRKELANKNYHELIFTDTKVRNLLKSIIMKQGSFDNDSLPHKFDDDFDAAFKSEWPNWFTAEDLISQFKVHGIHAQKDRKSSSNTVRLNLDPGEYAKMSAMGKASAGRTKNSFQIKMSRRKAYNSAVNYQLSKCLGGIYKIIDNLIEARGRSPEYRDNDMFSAYNNSSADTMKKAQNNRYGPGSDKMYGIPSKSGLGLHGEEGDDTTVAMMGFLKSLKKVSSLVQRGNMSGKQNTFWDAKVNQISNLFETKSLSIDKASMADYLSGKKELDIDKIVIKIELGSAADQDEMSIFDAKQLKQDMENFKSLALDTIVERLKNEYTLEFKGSKTRRERASEGVTALAADEILKGIKHGTITNSAAKKYKGYNDKKKKAGRPKSTGKTKRNKKVTGMMTAAAQRLGTKRSHQKMYTATRDNPLALEALLNDFLPKVVASKMTSPALNFRTGRFAASAQVQDVMVGPRGGLNVNYTYMRDPYETFEPGNAMGSTQRDPRKIIGESVREIAQSIIGDRFLRVRRV